MLVTSLSPAKLAITLAVLSGGVASAIGTFNTASDQGAAGREQATAKYTRASTAEVSAVVETSSATAAFDKNRGFDWIDSTPEPQLISRTEAMSDSSGVIANWYVGVNSPRSSIGRNGDFYFDVANTDVYVKLNGSWGTAFTTLTAGLPQNPPIYGNALQQVGFESSDGVANRWLAGSSNPTPKIGIDNDFYFNVSNGNVHIKVDGVWSEPISNLFGRDGEPGRAGTKWWVGETAPSDADGIDGDLFMNLQTGDVYQKQGDSWNLPISTLQPATTVVGPAGTRGAQGPVGPSGPVGPPGPAGADGVDGINGVDGADGADGSDGADGADGVDGAQGPAGPQGPAGAAGADGAAWYSGSGVPSDGLGSNGDYYLDSSTGFVYEKNVGTWGAAVANIAGPQGPQGAQGPQGTQGIQGVQGVQGPQGSQGPAGLSNLEVISESKTSSPGTTLCTGGKSAISGGYQGTSLVHTINASYPESDLSGWTVEASGVSGLTPITVYVVCADVN